VTIRFLTIPISHYGEKVRWALDRLGLPYVEERHLQGFHYAWSIFHASTPYMPIVILDGIAVADSTAILQRLDAMRACSQPLYPAHARREVLALEERFDGTLGIESRRWVYHRFGDRPEQVLAIAGQGVPSWEVRVFRALYPHLFRFLRFRLEVRESAVASGKEAIARELDFVAERLADGRRHLLGDAFTAADLAFAAMAAPIVMPAEYGIHLPMLDELPSDVRAEVEAWRAHPAGAYALRLYREERRARVVAAAAD
jgi:glutathione S-transferase